MDVVEEGVAPRVLEERGYKMLPSAKNNGDDNGIDHFAWDPEENRLVIGESKFYGKSGSASTGSLSNRGDRPQMTRDWINHAWRNEDHSINFDEMPQEARNDIITSVKDDGSIPADARDGIETVEDAIVTSARHNSDIPEPRRGDISSVDEAITESIRFGQYQREFVSAHPYRNGNTISSRSNNVADQQVYWGQVADHITTVKLGSRDD